MQISPTQAWRDLREGNRRFVNGSVRHPDQGADARRRLAQGQNPKVVVFGCSDSRVAAEIIFDQGLGDMFVVRTAGHVLDASVLGSIEFAVGVLDVPLIIVLGHDSCGGVGATVSALDDLSLPDGHIRDVVERITPSILIGRSEGLTTVDEFVARHVQETARMLTERSGIVASKVQSGEVGILGLTYRLGEGQVNVCSSLGDLEVDPPRSRS
ncbi:carbonic anhydrase [Gordonia sp. GONU]|nr:carbonic anhydrase [Gordonia sp. GONU]